MSQDFLRFAVSSGDIHAACPIGWSGGATKCFLQSISLVAEKRIRKACDATGQLDPASFELVLGEMQNDLFDTIFGLQCRNM